MSKKTKTLIAALGIVLLLAGGYYGATAWKKKEAAAAPSGPAAPALGNLESSALVKIEAPGLTLEKRGDTWELTSLEGGIPQAGIDLDGERIQALTYSLANVWTDRIVNDSPRDLAEYGLDTPSVRTIVTDSAGKRAEYLLGDTTPSRTGRYVMQKGDPAVYAVSAYAAETLRFSLDSIRRRTLFPAFEQAALTGFLLERADGRPENRVEITLRPEAAPPYLSAAFSPHILTAPYSLPRGINGEFLQDFLGPLSNLQIAEFVDDNPSSLAPYGLDRGARFFLRTGDNSLDLLVGNETNGNRYAKLAGGDNVFTVGGMESILNVKPFDLIDKFILLINIDTVDRLLVRGGEKNLAADFTGKGDDGIYFLDGRKAETKSFKEFYQAVIGLTADAEYPRTAAPPAAGSGETKTPDSGEITIEFFLNTPAGTRVSASLVPYNRDFYAVRQDGTTEFLVSRNQVRNIYEKAGAVAYAE